MKIEVRARAGGSASSISIAEGGQEERQVIPTETLDPTGNELKGIEAPATTYTGCKRKKGDLYLGTGGKSHRTYSFSGYDFNNKK